MMGHALETQLNDDAGINFSSLGQCLMFVSGRSTVATWGLSLALTVCELRAIVFVSWQYVYKFDCFPVMKHWIHVHKEASARA